MKDALNLQYLRRWVKENRPDLVEKVEEIILKNQAYHMRQITDPTGASLLMMAMLGFEAGRLFQKENPDAGEADYAPKPEKVSSFDDSMVPGARPGDL